MCRMLRHLDASSEKNQVYKYTLPSEYKKQCAHFFDTIDVDAFQVLGTFDEYGGNQVTEAIKKVSGNKTHDQSTIEGRRQKAATATFVFPESELLP